MKLKPILTILGVAIALLMWSSPGGEDAMAAGNQSNQDLNQPAVLYAPDAKTEIRVYAKPGNGQRPLGYGLKGDPVTVIEQVGSNEGYQWDYVRFDPPAKTEGWVRDDFVSFQDGGGTEAGKSPRFTPGGNGYLGNQAGHSNPSAAKDSPRNSQSQWSQQRQGHYPPQSPYQ